jgi:predicted transcriptional regulator
MERKEIEAHLDEIQDKITKQLAEMSDLTQKTYDEAVKAVVAEYSLTQKISADEAREMEANLRGGYEALRQTIHEHTAPAKPPIGT